MCHTQKICATHATNESGLSFCEAHACVTCFAKNVIRFVQIPVSDMQGTGMALLLCEAHVCVMSLVENIGKSNDVRRTYVSSASCIFSVPACRERECFFL